LVKVSVNRFLSSRIITIRNEVNADTQRLRQKTLNKLEEIFRVTARVARGEIKHQRINHKLVRITLRQRRKWLLIAEQTVKTINNIADNFDEQQINLQLNELEKLVKEANIIPTKPDSTPPS
jgi:truncated hemoglobin YjbI